MGSPRFTQLKIPKSGAKKVEKNVKGGVQFAGVTDKLIIYLLALRHDLVSRHCNMVVHQVHSHAHEIGIPGTVDLKAVEGDDTVFGQALFPVPSSDPNDPLNWPKFK